MCQECFSPEAWTRRRFIRRVAAAAAVSGLATLTSAQAAAEAAPALVAGSGWARLRTGTQKWDFHADREARLLKAFKGMPDLGYRGDYRRVGAGNLAELCRSRFLFSFDLANIGTRAEWDNLREYLYRGGFLFLDSCVVISPRMLQWRRDHLERLTRLLPASEWRRLSTDHPVFNTPFKTEMPSIPEDRRRGPEEQRTFYGIFDDNRMVVLVSQAQLFCGWPENPEIVRPCMELMANIYHYARTH